MSKVINGAIEFVSSREKGGIDTQINNWVTANPTLTIIDVKYRVAFIQDGSKTKLAKLALLLYHQAEKVKSQSPPKLKTEPKPAAHPEPTADGGKKPGARTMVMNLRKDLNFDELDDEL